MSPSTETGTTIPRWLPNAISSFRILLVPVWGVSAELCRDAFLSEQQDAAAMYRMAALFVLLAIGVSDVVDGYLARRFGLATRIGATLDAFADKIAQVGLLLFFAVRGAPAFTAVPLWFLLLVFGRDLLIGVAYVYVRRRIGSTPVKVVHRAHGKAASVLLFVLFCVLTTGLGAAWIEPLMWVLAGLIIFSTVLYSRDGVAVLREAKRTADPLTVPRKAR